MMKKLLLAVAFVALFVACKPKQPEKPALDPTGIWELTSISTKVSVGDVAVSVYLEFSAEGTFTIYQKIGEGRYKRFTGTFEVDLDNNRISGKYDGGAKWGPYDCTCNDKTLTLKLVGGTETDSYTKIEAVPADVAQNVYAKNNCISVPVTSEFVCSVSDAASRNS